MQAFSTTSQQDLSEHNSFIQPPASLAKQIQVVANHIANHGIASECQLRSSPDGRERYPFLFPGYVYEPYYQQELYEAFARRDAAAYVPANQLFPSVSDETIAVALDNTDDSGPVKMRQDVLAQFMKCTYDKDRYTPLAVTAVSQHNITNDSTSDQRIEHHLFSTESKAGGQRWQNLQVSSRPNTSRTKDQSRRASGQNLNGITPYSLQQEVHLLDSNGTERSGLSTYVITDYSKQSTQTTMASSTLASVQLEGAGFGGETMKSRSQEELIYHLQPDTSVTFRVSHHRVLPVGFPLGAEVQQFDNAAASIVVRRTVEEWRRLYDVKDEFGDTYTRVPEENLQLRSGGFFDFRTPNEQK